MANNKIQKCKVMLQRRDAQELHDTIESVTAIIKGGSFELTYAMRKNRNALRDEVDAIGAMLSPSPKFQEYTGKRIALCEEHAVKNEDGSSKLTAQGNYVIDPEKQAEFNEKVEALQNEHRPVLDGEGARRSGIPDFLKAEVEVELYCFPLALLNPHVKDLTQAQRVALFPLYTNAEDEVGEIGELAEAS